MMRTYCQPVVLSVLHSTSGLAPTQKFQSHWAFVSTTDTDRLEPNLVDVYRKVNQ